MLGGCIDPCCVQRLHSLKHCSTAFGCIMFLSLLKWGHALVGHGTEIIMLGCSIKSPSFCSVRYPCVVLVVRATPRFLVASSLRAPPGASTALECCEEHAAWWLHGTFVLLLLFSLPLQGHDTNASSLNLPSAQSHGAVNMRGACVKPLYSLAHIILLAVAWSPSVVFHTLAKTRVESHLLGGCVKHLHAVRSGHFRCEVLVRVSARMSLGADVLISSYVPSWVT